MRNGVIKALRITGLEDKEIESVLEVPKDSNVGDYAFPCFVLSRKLKKNPSVIASELASKIKKIEGISRVEAVGPYLNFFVNSAILSEATIKKITSEGENYGKQKIRCKTVIEVSSPNSNKPLHLGHARNIILGQSVSKISEFVGNDVKIVTVNNDRGVHICKSMLAYKKFGGSQTPESTGIKSDHFVGDYYVKFSKEAEKDKALEDEAQDCLRKWEAGDTETVRLLKKMNGWAFKGFKETYKEFGLKFDKEYFESQIYKEGKKIILDALKKGKANKKEDGAIFADLNDVGLGEKILLRKDGTSIYIVQDLYLAELRKKELKFDKMFYVVASEQDYHFKVLFELLKRFGYSWAENLHHLSYGMVNLESGRMKSREGTVVDIDDLIADLKKIASEEIEKRYEKISAKELSERAKAISMAALRYYFLKVDKIKDITFKPKDSLKFEGDTGPYLLYSYARARSVLRKAKYKRLGKVKIDNVEAAEKELVDKMSKFPEVVLKSYESLSPNLIANYSFELCQIFSSFYHSCPVIGSEKEGFRLSLVDCFSQTLKNALGLLDIPVIEEM